MYDNAPLVVREASAMGTPSILVRNSTAAQGVEDRVNGFLCENNTESLRDTMLDASGSRKQLKSAAMHKKTLAKTWDMIVDHVYAEYEKIIHDYHANHEGAR